LSWSEPSYRFCESNGDKNDLSTDVAGQYYQISRTDNELSVLCLCLPFFPGLPSQLKRAICSKCLESQSQGVAQAGMMMIQMIATAMILPPILLLPRSLPEVLLEQEVCGGRPLLLKAQ
jgi:hypothetical protein